MPRYLMCCMKWHSYKPRAIRRSENLEGVVIQGFSKEKFCFYSCQCFRGTRLDMFGDMNCLGPNENLPPSPLIVPVSLKLQYGLNFFKVKLLLFSQDIMIPYFAFRPRSLGQEDCKEETQRAYQFPISAYNGLFGQPCQYWKRNWLRILSIFSLVIFFIL